MKHIMAAIDGSEASYRALEHAAKLASAVDSKLSVLIAREYIVGRKHVMTALSNEELLEVQNKTQEIIAASGNPPNELLVEKSRDAAYTIVDVAIERSVDLIVMGASGKGGFKTFLLGSVSQEVLRKAACPVTIVH